MSRHSWVARGRLEHWWLGEHPRKASWRKGAVLCPLPLHPQHPAPAWHLVFPTLLHTDVKAFLSLLCGRDWITYEPEHLYSLPKRMWKSLQPDTHLSIQTSTIQIQLGGWRRGLGGRGRRRQTGSGSGRSWFERRGGHPGISSLCLKHQL